MISVTLVEWTRLALVPVMVNVRLRFATFDFVATVSTDVPEPTTEAGEKVTVARVGAPLTERFTVSENPDPAVMVTVYVAVPPVVIVRLTGVTAIEKSPVTTSVTVTL
jgi:hypothetical protein